MAARVPAILRLAASLLVLLVAGCKAPPLAGGGPAPLSGFTCCNLRFDGDWIGDSNLSSLPMIPAGAQIRTTEYSRNRIKVEVEGRPMRLGLDLEFDEFKLHEWARTLIVGQDPSARIASWPAPVRELVAAGRIAPGMTQEQVIVSIGYPSSSQTPALDLTPWKYWHSQRGDYFVIWDEAGRVRDIVSDAKTRRAVLGQ